ncbi:hypothetical protein [Rossellomorea vietnamensis]|uniref:Uncharacterized protein n=1 Tax=Rossellomorea vietnamensis TaxID=218284 RepID=A0ACD4C8W1_9BACI|nr:hypothetical protein [Rossellomorea vietnamensis]UXH44851.1 hypothetical protein N5C46_01930 [Rossellomorea vietnamensis]WQI96210.1 hypothetical protein Q7C14_02045 [Rossellomorea vietnamensis]
MNKTFLLNGLRWMFIFLIAFVIVVYVYKRSILHNSIQSSIRTLAPGSTVVGIIQTHTTKSHDKIYRALYKTEEGTCFRASFERTTYTLIENQESPCQ